MTTATLLLNSTFEPLRILPLRRALNLVLSGKAVVMEESDKEIKTQSMTMKAPLIIRMRYFVRVPYRARLPLTRKNLTARDFGKCGYCGRAGSTIDHIIPRAKGGQHTWENTVLACSPCNSAKADKTLAELTGKNARTGEPWELKVTPKPPFGLVWFVIGLEVHESWEQYLTPA